MKKIVLFIPVLLLSGFVSLGQDMQFLPSVISSGGGSSSNHAVNLSRWRIGEIHVVTFPSDEVTLKQPEVAVTILSDEWSATVYPNPVTDLLKIRFDIDKSGEFAYEITDITGRKLSSEKASRFLPGQVLEIDLSGFTPALYLLSIIPSGEYSRKLFKITKE